MTGSCRYDRKSGPMWRRAACALNRFSRCAVMAVRASLAFILIVSIAANLARASGNEAVPAHPHRSADPGLLQMHPASVPQGRETFYAVECAIFGPVPENVAALRLYGFADQADSLQSARCGFAFTHDHFFLRIVYWPSLHAMPRGTVFVIPGRSDFPDRYLDVVAKLRARGFAVISYDLRGQGLSQRAPGMARAKIGHVGRFDEYFADLEAVMQAAASQALPAPYLALAHSLGGAVFLSAPENVLCGFSAAVLSAPMIEIQAPIPPSVQALLVAPLLALGLGAYALPDSVTPGGFAGNPYTTDKARYERMINLRKNAPGLYVGPPSIAWLAAARSAMDRLRSPWFELSSAMPVLIVGPEKDAIASSPAMRAFAARHDNTTFVAIKDARHQILNETDANQTIFWRHFDAFVADIDTDQGRCQGSQGESLSHGRNAPRERG